MGNITSSEEVISAALKGDAAFISERMSKAENRKHVLAARTGMFAGKKNLLHLACKAGQHMVISSILHPLVDAVAHEIEIGTYPGQATSLLDMIINQQDSRGRTPLLAACYYGRWECAELLLEAGSNIFACDKDGNGILHLAAISGQAHLMQHLLAKADTQAVTAQLAEAVNLSGFTPLHYAAHTGNADIVRRLVIAGVDLFQGSWGEYDRWLIVPLGSTALHVAAFRLKASACLVMLEYYALLAREWLPGHPVPVDPRSMTNQQGSTPYSAAVWKGMPANCHLATLLNPGIPIHTIIQPDSLQELIELRRKGPQSLRVIAAEAAKHHLLHQLAALARQHAKQQTLKQQQGLLARIQQQQHQQHRRCCSVDAHHAVSSKPPGSSAKAAKSFKAAVVAPIPAADEAAHAASSTGIDSGCSSYSKPSRQSHATAYAAVAVGLSTLPGSVDGGSFTVETVAAGVAQAKASPGLQGCEHGQLPQPKRCSPDTADILGHASSPRNSSSGGAKSRSPDVSSSTGITSSTGIKLWCSEIEPEPLLSSEPHAAAVAAEDEADEFCTALIIPTPSGDGGKLYVSGKQEWQAEVEEDAASLLVHMLAPGSLVATSVTSAMMDGCATLVKSRDASHHNGHHWQAAEPITEEGPNADEPAEPFGHAQPGVLVDLLQSQFHHEQQRQYHPRMSMLNQDRSFSSARNSCTTNASPQSSSSSSLISPIRRKSSFKLDLSRVSRRESITGSGGSALFSASKQQFARIAQAAHVDDPQMLSYTALARHSRTECMTAATSLAGALPGCVSDRLAHCYDSSSFLFCVHGGSSIATGSRTTSRNTSGIFSAFSALTAGAAEYTARRVSQASSVAHGEVCAVCMDKTPAVMVAGCSHEMCFDCAKCIVGEGVGCRPPLCPFCRRNITGFTLPPVTIESRHCSRDSSKHS